MDIGYPMSEERASGRGPNSTTSKDTVGNLLPGDGDLAGADNFLDAHGFRSSMNASIFFSSPVT